MQILNSGSFINLDNREKIEQLIFTAKQVAHAALETEGFVNKDENNRQLALEIWQGAEYMCRDHEEANIKNIFVKNFLEQLRELKGASETPSKLSENVGEKIENNVPHEDKVDAVPKSVEQPKQSDEFLGFVSHTESTGQGSEPLTVIAGANETDKNESETCENAINENDSIENRSAVGMETFASAPTGNEVNAVVHNVSDDLPAAIAFENDELRNKTVNKSNEFNLSNAPVADEADDVIQSEANEGSTISAITLPEKEPYQFDKCTVTATIQLLPTNLGTVMRKAVLSVRTHNFAPQISIVELENGGKAEELAPALAKVLEDYRNNLPVKVMDKLKKEKPVAKRQSSASKTTPATVNKIIAQTVTSTNTIAESATTNRETVNEPAVANYNAPKVQNVAVADNANAVSMTGVAAKIVSNTSTLTKPSLTTSNKKTNSQASKATDNLQGSLFGF